MPHRALFLFLLSPPPAVSGVCMSAPALEDARGVTGVCCWRTSWPPTMLVLNTDWGVLVKAAISFSSSFIFFLGFF